jgi:hypothetical protein
MLSQRGSESFKGNFSVYTKALPEFQSSDGADACDMMNHHGGV